MGLFGEKLLAYAYRLKERRGFFLSDVKRLAYFANNPRNQEVEVVKLKLSVLNHKQINDLACQQEMTNHIITQNIDEDLDGNALTAVTKLAKFQFKGNEYHLLAFASAYCNSHKPSVFPIYDVKHLGLMKQYMSHYALLGSEESLEDYSVFKRGLDHLMNHYRLDELLNYYEVKKLSWLYLDKLLAEEACELNQ